MALNIGKDPFEMAASSSVSKSTGALVSKSMSQTAKANYPYLRFDAFSMKDLINKKLSEDSNLTDYIYEGSNLSIFIDIISAMFESLSYNLNQSASESMMSDSNIYSNISRLVKFLGYSPAGYKSSTVTVKAVSKSKDFSFLVVPKYSTITLSQTDSFGRNVSFSTTDYFYVNGNSTNNINLVNGRWKHYSQSFDAEGDVNETFILDKINVEGSESEFVAYPYIEVYVKRPLGNGSYSTIHFSPVTDGIYIDTTDDSILTPTDNKFALRLNEDKKYEIEFGDGIHGAMLKQGDIVHVVYLLSNGNGGEIGNHDIDNRQFIVGIDGITKDGKGGKELSLMDILELDTSYSNSIFAYSDGNPYGNDAIIGNYLGSDDSLYNNTSKTFFYGCTNYEKSSTPTEPETVEQIRKNAPAHFRRSGRTITADNFVAKIKEKFYSDIVDCVVMNNMEYMSTFYRWLWELGIEKLGNPRKWINPSIGSIGTYGYRYADATDANNVYIWIKQETESNAVGNAILTELRDEIPLTSRPVIVQAVSKKFAICAGFTETRKDDGSLMTLREYYNGSDNKDNFIFSDKGQNRLEVELSPGTNISSSIIKNRILEIFRNFFSSSYMNIGSTVSIGELENQILDINGVERVRTIFRKVQKDGSYSKTDIIKRSGVSLAHWNDNIVAGYDIETTDANVTLEPFQYPEFYDFSTIINQIDIVCNSSSNIDDRD